MAEALPNIDLIDLRMLHELECTGSLVAVSDRLQMSQPAVSQRIKRLEERLQVPLTERAGRGVRLTPAGQILAGHGAKVVAEFEGAFEKIAALKDGSGGTLRLVGFPSASATVVPEMMRHLAEIAPGVTLKYREAEPPAALELLREGQVDCALIFDYQNSTQLPAGAKFTPLWREQLHLVVADADPRVTSRGTVQLGKFRRDTWIAGCEKCRGNLLQAAAESGFMPNIVQETDNIPAMVAMVAAGGAVALVPGLALAGMRTLPPGAVAAQLNPPRFRTVGLVALEATQENPAARLAQRLTAKIDAASWNLLPVAVAVG